MENTETIRQVIRARAGDKDAFDWLVRHFRGRAVAYAYSILGGIEAAHDAAQEAFVEAYLTLPTLRQPAAFPALLRTLVFKHCDRRTRQKRLDTLPLQAAEQIYSPEPGPAEVAERREREEEIARAVQSLPEGQRAVVAFFYLGGRSHRDIAEFLGLPATTVKSRLYQARRRLKEKLFMINDNLQSDVFVARVSRSIEEALASMTPDMGRASFYAEHPVESLQNSFLVWAIEAGASEMRFLPSPNQSQVQLVASQTAVQTLSLPEALYGPLLYRLKVSAEMNPEQLDAPQEGTFPIRYKEAEYEAFVSSQSSERGEIVRVRIVAGPTGGH